MSEITKKKQRKRKNEDEDGSAVSKLPKSEEKPTPQRKKSVKLLVKEFRKKLQEDDFISGSLCLALSDFHNFYNLATENPAIIQEYLEVGGQPLEIVECLGKIDKNSLDHISCIFSVLQLVLIEILSQSTQYTTIAINGCRFLLNKQRSCVESLLESHATNHRKIALKVLTAIVTVDSRMGFDVLKLFRSHINSRSLEERFARPRKEEINHPESSLRTAFTHFVLAYLVEGNSVLIQNILDRMELLVAVLRDLQYDSPENIVLVLGTLRNFVLKKVSVSKTQKFHLFSAEIVTNLLELYNWKGSAAFLALANNQSTDSVIPEVKDVEIVSSAVHDFLVLLLTSNKHGIVVQSLGNRKKKNYIPSIVLKNLERPWNNRLHETLAIRVLKACPEQVEFFLRARARVLESEHSDGLKFLDFLVTLINSLSPKIIEKVTESVGMAEMCGFLKNICFSPEILEKIRRKMQRKLTFQVRLSITKLLMAMLSQSSNYLTHLSELEMFQDFEMKIIKADLFDHILSRFPTMDAITMSLYKTIDEQKTLNSEGVLKHLEATVDLLTIAQEIIPTFIDKTTSLINYMQFMEPLQEDHSRIQLKIIKLILAMDPQTISPGTALFSNVMTSFLNIYTLEGKDEGQEVEILLRNILFSTRLFDNGPLEIDIWLEAFKSVDSKDTKVVQEFFIKLINRIRTQPQNCAEEVPEKGILEPSGENLASILDRIEKNETTVGIFDVPGLNNLLSIAVNLLAKKTSIPVVKYLENVVFNLFHYLPNYHILPPIVKKLALGVSDYMAASMEGKALAFPCEFSQKEAHKFIQKIVQKEKFEEFDVKSDGKAFNMIYLIIFYLNKLHNLSKLDSETSSKCCEYLMSLLEGIHNRQVTNCQRKQTIELDDVVKVKIDRKNPLIEILKYIFCGQIHLLTNFCDDLQRESRPMMDFVGKITKRMNDWITKDDFHDLTVNYRNKFVQNFRENVTMNEDLLLLMRILDLDHENCVDFLKILGRRGEFHEVLVMVIQRVTELREKSLSSEVIKEICGIFISITTKGTSETAINALSDALTDYLNHFHSSIGDVPEDLLHNICVGERNTKPLTKLATLLLERKASLLPIFLQTLEGNYTKKELMYPLLSVVLMRKDACVEKKLLQRIYGEYKNGIFKSIEKPQKSGVIYRENFSCSLRLIEECMSEKDCVEFTKKTLKTDSVEIFQCLLIEKIYQKAIQKTDNSSIHVNFYKNLLNLYTFLLKKSTLQVDKLTEMARILTNWRGNDVDFSPLTESQIWTNFARNCLKIGLQQEKGDLPINLLAILTDKVYPDDCGDEFLKELYEMTLSHSNFLGVFLQREKCDRKTATALLLLVLAKKSSQGFDKTHVPLFLGAYGAKMCKCDRFILALLYLYEKNGVDFSQYRPFLWGEAAISHYSLEDTEGTVQGILEEPSMDMVMSIISPDTLMNTISNFPIWRRLNALMDLPMRQIDVHDMKTEIEMIIDGDMPKDEKFSGLVTRRQDTWDEVYDPAFLVPLVSAMFAPEVLTSTVSVAQNGLLGLVLLALSSDDEEMRLIAGLALIRYKRQMEGRKEFLDRNVWLQFYGGIQNGLAALGKVMGSPCPRLSHVSANFLARASMVLTTPLVQLYRPIADYVLSKECYDLSVVPNFNFMFLSADVEQQCHREFVLSVIADGVKCAEDFDVLELSGALETIMVFFSCPFATIDTNLRILSVINTITKMPSAAKKLVDKFGLVPWLSGIIGNLETFYYDTIDALVHIIVNLWCSMEFLGDGGDGREVHHLAVRIVEYLSARVPMALLAKFIRVLNRTSVKRHHLLTGANLDHLIECAKPLIGSEISAIMQIRESGAEYAEESEQYAKRVTMPESRVALINLREYVINWTVSQECLPFRF
ncbi:nucleolar pre-ribosomal-associated protein 1 [Phlebotomus argentipes]|uniref:nucleolar pre-ribosomal-associated protein 1 n=1 Tax=Phlebotomus argentipes TaxID=94469 RepID=UPI0028937E9E|nr:nucleolar pre-ribosomal-associated protein 1 [Phlebotomus argentipes]